MKLSIIVPVYGVEKYILEFAESLIFQLTEDVELILINDGTKDESINIIKKYVNENFSNTKNILWLEQKNQGQSVARNYGISLAKGEYITFLDPDDIVNEKYITILLSNLENNIDILEFNAISFKSQNGKLKELDEIILCEKKGYYKDDLKTRRRLINSRHWFSWVRVFRKSIIPSELFPKGYNFQDMMSLPFLYQNGVKVYGINEILVKYRVHEKSAVSLISERLVKSSFYGINIYKKASENDEIYIGKYIHFIEIYCKYSIKYYGVFKGVIKSFKVIREFRKFKFHDYTENKFVGNFYIFYLFLYGFYICFKRVFK